MYRKRKGQVTVWLALTFLVFLSLYLICLESVQKQSARRMAEQVAESSLFSLFSEYEPHLLEQYDLFYLDTSFRSGKENRDELCSHLWKFTEDNLKRAQGGTALNFLGGVKAYRRISNCEWRTDDARESDCTR